MAYGKEHFNLSKLAPPSLPAGECHPLHGVRSALGCTRSDLHAKICTVKLPVSPN